MVSLAPEAQASARPSLSGIMLIGQLMPTLEASPPNSFPTPKSPSPSPPLRLPPPCHPCPGLGFEASWQPTLLSLGLGCLGEFKEADQLAARQGGTFSLQGPHPGWSQVSGAGGRGWWAVRLEPAWLGGEWIGGGELAPPGEEGKREAMAGLGTPAFHKGRRKCGFWR